MRGVDGRSGELFSYVDLEDRVPAQHPLRAVRSIVNEVLAALDGKFSKLYSDTGRNSIPPERLLRALLLQTFYTIRFAGSWDWEWTSRCGLRRYSRRTATGCSMRTWRVSS